MGFWGSFFGHVVTDAIKENNRHNDMCNQLSNYQTEMEIYLSQIGSDATYIVDYSCIDTGSTYSEKIRMENTKKKVEEYLKLGGDPKYLHNADDIDDAIEKVKLLKSKDLLHRQKEFEYSYACQVEYIIDDEEYNSVKIEL